MDWSQLREALEARVRTGQVTTYGRCSVWAFGHSNAAPAIVAMLEAMARRGHHLSSNRVVQDDGGIAAHPDEAYGQRRQLESEGVPFDTQGRVDMIECPPVVL